MGIRSRLDIAIEKGLALNPGFTLQDYVAYIEAGKHKAVLIRILQRGRMNHDSHRQRI